MRKVSSASLQGIGVPLIATKLLIHYQAFAHNDYLNLKPLTGVPENGF